MLVTGKDFIFFHRPHFVEIRYGGFEGKDGAPVELLMG